MRHMRQLHGLCKDHNERGGQWRVEGMDHVNVCYSLCQWLETSGWPSTSPLSGRGELFGVSGNGVPNPAPRVVWIDTSTMMLDGLTKSMNAWLAS